MKFCPHCKSNSCIKKGSHFVLATRSYRKRFQCRTCLKGFSKQTTSFTKYQKKPYLNEPLFRLLVSGNTQRGSARLLGCNKNTVDKKLQGLKLYLNQLNSKFNLNFKSKSLHIQIDEMESIEHTKLKPLTLPLCVTSNYEIIATSVGQIPAKGRLSEVSRKKYGYRENQREIALRNILNQAKKSLINEPLTVTTDSYPLYPRLIKEYFPNSKHIQVVSRLKIERHRELIHLKQKKKVYDPLFQLNQRCAKLRADIKRLARRSWCTTKKPENLKLQLELYQIFNNQLVHS